MEYYEKAERGQNALKSGNRKIPKSFKKAGRKLTQVENRAYSYHKDSDNAESSIQRHFEGREEARSLALKKKMK